MSVCVFLYHYRDLIKKEELIRKLEDELMSIDGEKLLLSVIQEFKDDFKSFKEDMTKKVSNIDERLRSIEDYREEHLTKLKGRYALRAAVYGGIFGTTGVIVVGLAKIYFKI